MRAATVVQVLQDFLLHVLFYLWSLLKCAENLSNIFLQIDHAVRQTNQPTNKPSQNSNLRCEAKYATTDQTAHNYTV